MTGTKQKANKALKELNQIITRARLENPCPFCGEQSHVHTDRVWLVSFQVKCMACGARGARENSPGRAIANWNRIPNQTRLKDAAAGLLKFIEKYNGESADWPLHLYADDEPTCHQLTNRLNTLRLQCGMDRDGE